MNPIQEYYDLEKNAEIRWFWNAGFVIEFGDCVNGFTEHIECATWQEVEEVFRKRVEGLKNESI
jgi:hypothetical protein